MNKEIENKVYVKGLVSVVIPVYNSQRYLKEMLDSVCNQTYKKIEIIIVDDRSTDCSANIIDTYKKTYHNIIYYLQDQNRGAGCARNKGIEISSGQYIAFLDSDDIWKNDKIERQIRLMNKKNAAISYTAIEMINEKGNRIKEKRDIKKTVNYKYLLKNTIIATSSVVIDRNIVGDFRMNIRRSGQDYATWLSLLRNGTVAYGINDSLVRYRIRKNSLSHNKAKSIKQIYDIQTNEEGLKKMHVFINIFCWSVNSLKKYFM